MKNETSDQGLLESHSFHYKIKQSTKDGEYYHLIARIIRAEMIQRQHNPSFNVQMQHRLKPPTFLQTPFAFTG